MDRKEEYDSASSGGNAKLADVNANDSDYKPQSLISKSDYKADSKSDNNAVDAKNIDLKRIEEDQDTKADDEFMELMSSPKKTAPVASIDPRAMKICAGFRM